MTKAFVVLGGVLLAGVAGWGQAPAGAPAGATGICKDGTYSTAASTSGACAGHKGVQTWYTAAIAAPKPAPVSSIPAMPAPSPTSGSGAVAIPAPAAAPAKKLSPAQAAAAKPAAPGGGKGLVWVNTASNVYHCGDDPFYGKTKAGAYMTEADAKAKGAHGERGKTCEGK